MDALQGLISHEIMDIRMAGQEHYRKSFDALCEKYNSIDPEHGGDVINIKKLQIVEDHGYIKNMKCRPLSFASQYYIERKEKLKLRKLSKKIKRFRTKNNKTAAKVLNSINHITAKQHAAKQSEKTESAKLRKSNSFTANDSAKAQDSSNSYVFPETPSLNEMNPAKQSKKRESTKASRSNSFTMRDTAIVLNSSNSSEFSEIPGMKENNQQLATAGCTPKSDGKKSIPRGSLDLNSIDKLFNYPQCKIDLTPVNGRKSHSSVMERSPLALLKGVKMDDIISCGTPDLQHAANSEQVTDYFPLKVRNEQFSLKCDSPKLRQRKTIKSKTAAKGYTACDPKSLPNNREKLFISSPFKSVSMPINRQRPFSFGIAKSPRISLKGIKVDDLCNTKYTTLDQIANFVKKNN